MNTKVISKTTKQILRKVSKHSPAIMTAIGVVSIVSTAVLAVAATPKAQKILEDGKNEIEDIENDDSIEKSEANAEIKAIRKHMCIQFAKLYWKPAANAAIGITAVIFANRIQHRRNLALASAYAISIKELADWKETARELKLINKNGEQKIRDRIAEKKIDKARSNPNQSVIFTGNGEDLFLDEWTGQVFKSSVTEVQRAVNDWNAQMLREDQVTLNDLYYLLRIPEVPSGDLGFEASHGIVNVEFGSALKEDKAYITMSFDREPRWL